MRDCSAIQMKGLRIPDVAAVAAIVWVVAATLHEGLGHGVTCLVLGGDPLAWSTFHFDCGRGAMTIGEWRLVSAAGTAVNLALLVVGWFWWCRGGRALSRLAAWTIVVVNGLTSFGYLVFSAAFGIGDWNRSGVLAGVANPGGVSVLLAVAGIAGYVAAVRLGASMLSHLPEVSASRGSARVVCVTIWATTGAVSLLAGLMAGGGWRATLGAALGVALGGNAGLLSMPRFVASPAGRTTSAQGGGPLLWTAAVVLVAMFAVVLGPGVSL